MTPRQFDPYVWLLLGACGVFLAAGCATVEPPAPMRTLCRGVAALIDGQYEHVLVCGPLPNDAPPVPSKSPLPSARGTKF